MICRLKHCSQKTEKFYVSWIRQYILFHNKQHPKDYGKNGTTRLMTELIYGPVSEPMST